MTRGSFGTAWSNSSLLALVLHDTAPQHLRVSCRHFQASVLTLGHFSLQVTNVDDEGVELGSGVMELTQSELVLHLHQREAVRWPYLCLRRYGYDSNLFSFESGRRCQTGQGEYQPCPPGQGRSLLQNRRMALNTLPSDMGLGGIVQSRERPQPKAPSMLSQSHADPGQASSMPVIAVLPGHGRSGALGSEAMQQRQTTLSTVAMVPRSLLPLHRKTPPELPGPTHWPPCTVEEKSGRRMATQG